MVKTNHNFNKNEQVQKKRKSNHSILNGLTVNIYIVTTKQTLQTDLRALRLKQLKQTPVPTTGENDRPLSPLHVAS